MNLAYLIYLQALFLAATYAVGVWETLQVSNSSITTPEVIEHGIASSGFAVLTGVVGFIAALQGLRRVSFLNLALFLVTLAAGSTGFVFLGNAPSPDQTTITNLSMMVTVAAAMPITGFSIADVLRVAKGGNSEPSPVAVMTYLALGALSLTIIAGAGVPSSALYSVAVVAHVGFAALTVALVLGVLVISLFEGFSTGEGWEAQRVLYSLMGLGFVAISGADGVVYMTAGGISYALVMAELAALVYVFLIIANGAPYKLRSVASKGSQRPGH
jgi:hypothetical protein